MLRITTYLHGYLHLRGGKVHDPEVHDAPTLSFKMILGDEIKSAGGEGGPSGQANPNPNLYLSKQKSNIIIKDNGIRTTYFEPLSNLDPSNESCSSIPLFSFTNAQAFQGMHKCASWAVRSWDYGTCDFPNLAPHASPRSGESIYGWFRRQRAIGYSGSFGKKICPTSEMVTRKKL